jgi:hypothetical protein
MTIALACAVATAVPAASGIAGNGNGNGGHSKSLAAKQCAAEKKADRAAFKAVHGKHAMRNCIRGTDSEIEDDQANAAQECRAERDEIGEEAFAEKYGTNEPKGEKSQGTNRNAFGKCVSGKVKDEIDADVEAFDNAARECRDERESDPEGFRETWGTNSPKGEKSKGAKRNAFGKCVSSKAKEADTEE